MSVRRAFAFSLASRQTALLLRLGGTVVLARLIAPDEFGLFMAAFALVGLLGTVCEFGVQNYLLQQAEIPHRLLQGAVGLALAATIPVVAAVAAAALLLPEGIWGREHRGIVLLLSAVLLFQPFTLPAQVRLRREMRFGALYVADLARGAAQLATALMLAALGYGALALAWAAVAEAAVGLIVTLRAAGSGALVRPACAGWRAIAGFGGLFTVIGSLPRVADNAVLLVLQALIGYAGVGLFTRARALADLLDRALLDGVGPVMVPLLARERRERRDLLPLYRLKVTYLSALIWPFFGFLALHADSVVALMLGGQWMAAVGAVRALALMGLFLPFTQMSLKFFVALDAQTQYLRIQATVQAVRVMLVAAGALVSLEAACLGFALGFGLKALLVTGPLKRLLGCIPGNPDNDLGDGLRRSALVGLVALAGPAAVLAWNGTGGEGFPPAGILPGIPALSGFPMTQLVRLTGAGVLLGAGWVVGLFVARHPLRDELRRVCLAVLPPPRGMRGTSGGLDTARR